MELNPVVRVDALGFGFGGRRLFNGFSAALPGGITWLRGSNGKGKTTLLKLLAGALAPHAGSIRRGELDSVRDGLAWRQDSYLCAGETPGLPWLTARELLDLHMALFPAAQAPLLAAQLEAFGIDGELDQPVTTLSLGQHKKLQLSLALALPVRLLLLDEPFNGLDTRAAAWLRAQLGAPQPGPRCVVLTSHVEPMLALASTLDLDGAATRA